jgi:hypothetical protein
MVSEMSELEQLENETFEEDDSTELPPQDVVAYNELRSCADLFRMYKDGILEIRPIFQREIVWKDPAQTRFIDSLVKQLPIPSMCFSLDYKSQNWQVIDGLQRMFTIIRFLTGSGWTLSKLDDIDPKISGKPISLIADRKSELHSYYTRVQNLTLPITVLRCDYQKKSHSNYIFTIFHRLNSGGSKLNNQEIRNCIYSGPFNEFLKELDANPNWMKINKMEEAGGYRYTKQELILRLFAFHDRYESYRGRLAKFLNDYMTEYRHPSEDYISEKRNLFERSVDIAYRYVFAGIIPPKLSISVLEATLVGVSFNLPYLESQTELNIQALHQKLKDHEQFSEDNLSEGLAGREKVIGRMSIAKSIFSGR